MSFFAEQSRYDRMEYRRCGESGLMLPIISLGFWKNFGTHDDFEMMARMCKIAFDNGITHFDLANNYGPEPGSAEENFGKIFRDNFQPYRDELVISTKAGYTMWDGPYGDWGSRKYMLASLDQSLMRMGIDYVDIFYHHRMDPNTPIEESMQALDSAVKSGKALYAGISNYDGDHLKVATTILGELKCPFIINQNRYSIFDRTIESNGLKQAVQEVRKGLIIFSPLAQGMLTDRYLQGIPVDSRAAKADTELYVEDLTESRIEQIRRLNDLATQRGQSLAQMALTWLLQNDCVTSVLIGASRTEQILDNLKVLDRAQLSRQELELIDEIVGIASK